MSSVFVSKIYETKKDRHCNSLTRKIPSVNLACFRYYQRTSDGLHMRCFAEKLRMTLHWELQGSPRKIAIKQRNHGCPNQIGSFGAKHPAPQTRLRRTQSKSNPSGSTYISKMSNLQLPCQLTQLVPSRRHTTKLRRLQILGPIVRNNMLHPTSPGVRRNPRLPYATRPGSKGRWLAYFD